MGSDKQSFRKTKLNSHSSQSLSQMQKYQRPATELNQYESQRLDRISQRALDRAYDDR